MSVFLGIVFFVSVAAIVVAIAMLCMLKRSELEKLKQCQKKGQIIYIGYRLLYCVFIAFIVANIILGFVYPTQDWVVVTTVRGVIAILTVFVLAIFIWNALLAKMYLRQSNIAKD